MGLHNLLSKVDRALVAFLISEGAGSDEDVFTEKNPGDRSNLPFTTCFSDSASEEIPYSGIYIVKASVTVHTNAAPDNDENEDEMVSSSDDRVSETFDAFHGDYHQAGDKLADLITSAAGGIEIVIEDVRITSIEQGMSDKDGQWLDTINLELTCRQ